MEKYDADPEFDAPIINAVWFENGVYETDILHTEESVSYEEGESHNIDVEIDWGTSSCSKIYLYQEGTVCALQESGNVVDIAKYFDPDEDIYIYAKNSNGWVTRRKLCLTSSTSIASQVFSGTSIKLADKLEFTLPENAGPLAGTKMSFDLSSLIPVEVEISDGKYYVAIGVSLSEKTKKDEKTGEYKTESTTPKNFADMLKGVTDRIKEAKDDRTKYDALRKFQKEQDKFLSSQKGSWGTDLSFTFMGFIEGYVDESGEFSAPTADGAYIIIDGAVEFSKQFLLGPVPMFFEIKLSDELIGEVKFALENNIDEIETNFEITNKTTLSAGIGVGLKKGLSASGGLSGSLSETIEIYSQLIQYFRLDASLDWYAKFSLLCFSWKFGDTITSATWYEYIRALEEDGELSSEDVVSLTNALYAAAYDSDNYTLDMEIANAAAEEFVGNLLVSDGGTDESTNNCDSDSSLFIENAYENAVPQTIVLENGTVLSVWLGNNSAYEAPNSLNLYYSYCIDGIWSDPALVCDDGTIDSSPNLVLSEDTAVVTWQNATESFSTGATLEDVAEHSSIVTAVFDTGTSAFTTSTVKQDNSVLPSIPVICTDGTVTYAVWQENSAKDWFGINGENTIVCSKRLEDGTWDESTVLFTAPGFVIDFDADCRNGICSVAACVDTDGDISTDTDLEIYLDGTRITDNGVIDCGVYFADHVLYWYSNGTLMDNQSGLVLPEGISIDSDRYRIVENDQFKALLYVSNDALYSTLYLSVYDEENNVWGVPSAITDGSKSISSFSPVLLSDGTIKILLEEKEVVDTLASGNPYGASSLRWFSYTPELGYDLKTVSASYASDTYVSGGDLVFSLQVTNTGTKRIKGIDVKITDSEGNLLANDYFVDPVNPGFSILQQCGFTVDEAVQGRKILITATVSGVTELNTADNTVEITLGTSNLSLENVRYGMNETEKCVINADIVNRGYTVQENITVKLIKETADGEILDTASIASLDSLNMKHCSFTVDFEEYVVYYIKVEGSSEENNYGDNEEFVVLKNRNGKALPLGDVSGNGKLGLIDAEMIRKYRTGSIDFAADQTLLADVNGDNLINAFDSMLIRRYLAGLITELPGTGTEISGISADETHSVKVTTGTVNAIAGETVAVPVVVKGSDLNISCFELYLEYNTDLLEPVYTSSGSSLVSTESCLPENYECLVSAENGICHIVADGLNTPVTEEGTLLYVFFRVKETATECTTQTDFTIDSYTRSVFGVLDTAGSALYIKSDSISVEAGTIVISSGNSIICSISGVDGSIAAIDGTEYVLTGDTIVLPDLKSTVVAVYDYNTCSDSDPHLNSPKDPKYYIIEEADNNGYRFVSADELDNCLKCIGASIRTEGSQGMRIVYGIPDNVFSALISSEGLNGYRLQELGTVAVWSSSGITPTLGCNGCMTAYAYNRACGYIDNDTDTDTAIQGLYDDYWKFSNAFTFSNMDRTVPDLTIRPYMILTTPEGENVTLYGGSMIRNIGYVALQNKAEFEASTDEYNFIWDIIEYVYPDQERD